MLTNSGDIEKMSDAIARGSYEYLVKSDWKIEDVIAEIQKKIGK